MLRPCLSAPALRPALLHHAPLPVSRYLHTSPALHKIVAGKYKVGEVAIVLVVHRA